MVLSLIIAQGGTQRSKTEFCSGPPLRSITYARCDLIRRHVLATPKTVTLPAAKRSRRRFGLGSILNSIDFEMPSVGASPDHVHSFVSRLEDYEHLNESTRQKDDYNAMLQLSRSILTMTERVKSAMTSTSSSPHYPTSSWRSWRCEQLRRGLSRSSIQLMS